MIDAKRIVIIGCGKLGIETASVLRAAGHTPIGLRRRPDVLPAWLDGRAVDVLDPTSLTLLPALKPDLVIYQATPGAYSENAYRDVYSTGVANVVSALQHCSAALIFVSSTGVYHQTDGSWVDETSETIPRAFNGQLMLAGERYALSMDAACVVRLSGIYGPNRLRLLERVRSGDWSPSDRHFTNRIHETDAARALAHIVEIALRAPKANNSLPRCWLVSDSEPAPYADVMHFLATELEVKPPESEVLSNHSGRRVGSKRCENKMLLESGFTFKYPNYRVGYQEIIRQLSDLH